MLACAQAGALQAVFTDAEVAGCDKIRIPKIVSTPSQLILWGQCRNYGASATTARRDTNASLAALGDDFSTNQIVSKTSRDGGKSWGNFRKWGSRGLSNPTPVYDRLRSAVVLLYQRYPTSDPSFNITTYVQVSKDDGESFGPAVDITSQLRACSL